LFGEREDLVQRHRDRADSTEGVTAGVTSAAAACDRPAAIASVEVVRRDLPGGDGVIETVHKMRTRKKNRQGTSLGAHAGIRKRCVQEYRGFARGERIAKSPFSRVNSVHAADLGASGARHLGIGRHYAVSEN
jgi:hypothetical protein